MKGVITLRDSWATSSELLRRRTGCRTRRRIRGGGRGIATRRHAVKRRGLMSAARQDVLSFDDGSCSRADADMRSARDPMPAGRRCARLAVVAPATYLVLRWRGIRSGAGHYHRQERTRKLGGGGGVECTGRLASNCITRCLLLWHVFGTSRLLSGAINTNVIATHVCAHAQKAVHRRQRCENGYASRQRRRERMYALS